MGMKLIDRCAINEDSGSIARLCFRVATKQPRLLPSAHPPKTAQLSSPSTSLSPSPRPHGLRHQLIGLPNEPVCIVCVTATYPSSCSTTLYVGFQPYHCCVPDAQRGWSCSSYRTKLPSFWSVAWSMGMPRVSVAQVAEYSLSEGA